MGHVVILGTANAVPGLQHENTHFWVQSADRSVLVDCPGNPVVRLRQANIDPLALTDVILTHFHPDHVSGFGPLLMDLWLMGRKTLLNVYGLPETIERAQQMMALYSWKNWPDFYPVQFIAVEGHERADVFQSAGLRVFASPVQHLIPTIGLRFEFHQRTLVYSCDTEPSAMVVRLAEEADILIHEATGNSIGHTSAKQAGEIASEAGAKSLYLIHYDCSMAEEAALVAEARQTFSGPVFLAVDFLRIPIGE